MSLPDISLNAPDLNRLHPIITLTRPIQDGVLNRSTLIKGLTNMIRHGEIENYFCFTELALDNLGGGSGLGKGTIPICCATVCVYALTHWNLENIDIVGDYISLKKLEVRHNVIQDLSALNSLNELEYLDVSHNCLKRILNFKPPKMLYHVDYSNNNIEHLDDLSHFWSLAYLDLSYNSIEHVNGLLELNHLAFLNLSHNGIKHINYSLPRSLMEINLSYNDLESIHLDMSSRLDISDCRHFIESEVIKNLLEVRFELSDKASRIASIVLSSEDEEEEKSALKSTVLEHLSAGRSPIGAGNNCGYKDRLLPMVILVGPPKTHKKELLNTIFEKHADKLYPAVIYTTNDLSKNRTLKTITVAEFNEMNSSGEFVFSYQFLGHSYGLS
ncbi:leucine-rich repeat and guanylate kinase domain-containing protein-like [Myzus persicae]|uniref:leucine-rich repeat and guanylate kinase domain-containing protein-like n=1 Tax=Myzus persicae TaxID=13164 RepID=UPI000B92FF91|nr:leucine-rich repeat and guanylate kinase domain-containing protein-like [Myzus persicae]